MSYTRSASHAAPNGRGWYEAIPERLRSIIDQYFVQVDSQHRIEGHGDRRMTGIIAPHAGIDYSGETAACAYAFLRHYLYPSDSTGMGAKVERIFIIGPSHQKGFEGFEISAASAYDTPFGAIPVDTAAAAAVMKAMNDAGISTNRTSRRTDEAEHSIEMQTPFLSHVLHFPPPKSTATAPAIERVSILPMIIGWTDRNDEQRICDVLRPYFSDPRNFFVFSSDFCHWGSRFSYTYHFKKAEFANIGDSIIAMDHAAMELLEAKNLDGWYSYLKKTENTICGRAAIGVGLHRWAALKETAHVEFVGYSQSNKCADSKDSSVSYAAAIIFE